MHSRRERRKHREKVKVEVDFQPTILKKPASKEDSTCDESDEKAKAPKVVPRKAMTMKQSCSLMKQNQLDCKALINFLDFENNNFCAVGVIGMANSGKSTILNLIATGKFHRCEADGRFRIENSLFSDHKSANEIEAFITKRRVILLDSAPVSYNGNFQEVILAEANDIRQIQALFRLCHEIIVVFESSQIMNLLRLIICARKMMNPYDCDEPTITLIENFVRPGSIENSITEMAKQVLIMSNISDSIEVIHFPDLNRLTPQHDDPMELIEKLRDYINTRKELKAYDDVSETERIWWEGFTNMKKTGEFLVKEYEKLRDRLYQQSERDIGSTEDL